jgi:hypothetical protein
VTGQRPWWASDGPVDGGVDAAEDPVERFRAARRGEAGPDPDPGDGDIPVDDRPGARDPRHDAGGAAGAPGATGPDPDVPDAGPWWEAAAETVSRLARDLAETADAQQVGGHGEDASPGAQADPGPGATPPPSGETRAPRGEAAEQEAPHRIDACGVCPICVGLRALGETRPELVGHLAEAARHVALAARSLGARADAAPRPDESLQRIDLDE